MWYLALINIYTETDEKESFQMACYSHDVYILPFLGRPSLWFSPLKTWRPDGSTSYEYDWSHQ